MAKKRARVESISSRMASKHDRVTLTCIINELQLLGLPMNLVEQFLVLPVFSLVGLAAAVIILARDLSNHERPSSSMAWLIAIVTMPIIAAPAYLLFGNRKLARVESRKLRHGGQSAKAEEAMSAIPRVLETYGVRPMRSGNRVQFIDDGVEAFEVFSGLIDEAQHSIHLMTFILATDSVGKTIVDKLCARAAAGVSVRVQVDAVGSWRSRLFLLRKLRRAGVQVGVFLPALPFWRRSSANLRNHRKIAVFDGTKAFAGGMNIGNEYFGPKHSAERWIDSSSVYEGPIVRDLDEIFIRDWQFSTEEQLEVDSPASATKVDGHCDLQAVPGGPDVEGDPLYDVVISAFHAAEKRIWICTPYFVPDNGLMRVLAMKARAGIDVRIYVPKHSDSFTADFVRNRMLRQLSVAGATVAAHPSKMVHAKHVLVDDKIAISGSANLDLRSLYINFEIAIFAYDNQSIRNSETMFNGYAESFTASPVPERNWLRGMTEDICWLASPLL